MENQASKIIIICYLKPLHIALSKLYKPRLVIMIKPSGLTSRFWSLTQAGGKILSIALKYEGKVCGVDCLLLPPSMAPAIV